MKRKLFAWILAIVMIVSLMPVSALAAQDYDRSVNAGSSAIAVGESDWLAADVDDHAACTGWEVETGFENILQLETSHSISGSSSACEAKVTALEDSGITEATEIEVYHYYTVTGYFGTRTYRQVWTVTVYPANYDGDIGNSTLFAWNQVGSAESGEHARTDETYEAALGKITVKYIGSDGSLKSLEEKAEVRWNLITSGGVSITAEPGWKITGISIRCNDNDGINCSTFNSHKVNMTTAYEGVETDIFLSGAEMADLWALHVANGGNGRGDPYWLCISVAPDLKDDTDDPTTPVDPTDPENFNKYTVTYKNDATTSPALGSEILGTDNVFLPAALTTADVNPIGDFLYDAEHTVDSLSLSFTTDENGYYIIDGGLWEFLGWAVEYSDTDAGDALAEPGDIIGVKGDTVLTAKWVNHGEHGHSIVYDPNGGAFAEGTADLAENGNVEFDGLEHGAAHPAPANEPTRSGYIFAGWGDDAADTAAITLPATVVGDAVYYAIWKPDVSVDKTANSESAKVGDTVTWTVTVTNNSTASQQFTIEDILTADAKGEVASLAINDREIKSIVLDTSNSSGVTESSGTYTIDAACKAVFIVTYEVGLADASTNLNNSVKVYVGSFTFEDAATPIPVEDASVNLAVSKNVSSIGEASDLESKTHDELPEAEPDDKIVWTVTVTATGTEGASALYNLVDELLIDGVETAATITPATYENVTITVGETHTYTVSYTVEEADRGKTISNHAIITDRDNDQIDIDLAEPVDVEGKKYEVHYRYSGYVPENITPAELPAAAKYEAGDTVTVAGYPTAPGYVFSGWFHLDATSASEEVKGTFSMPAHDVTLAGMWTPKAAVEKTLESGATASIGSTVEWKITVTNNTDVAQTFTLTDVLTGGRTVSIAPQPGNDGKYTVGAKSQMVINASYTVAAADSEAELVNTATIKLKDGYEFSDEAPKVTVEEAKAVLSVDKTLVSPNSGDVVKPGDTVVWKITASNTGNIPADVKLVDSIEGVKIYATDADGQKAAELSSLELSLQPGDNEVYIAEYTVTADDNGTVLKNKVTLDDSDPNTTDPEAEADPVYVDPVLSFGKTVYSVGGIAPEFENGKVKTVASVGDTVVWKITVEYVKGEPSIALDASNVIDELYIGGEKSAMKLYTDEACSTEFAEATLNSSNPKLELYASYTVASGDKSKGLVNTVTVKDNEPADAPEVKVEELEPGKLNAVKYVSRIVRGETEIYSGEGDIPYVKVGDTIYWNVVLTNSGEADVIVKLSEIMDTLKDTDGNVVVAEKPINSAEITIVVSPEGSDTLSNIYSYTVTKSDKGKTLANWLKLPGDEERKSDDEITVENPSLSITKTADKKSVTVGGKVSYTITVTNNGNVSLENVVVSDNFVKGGSGKLVVKSGDMNVGTLGVGQSATIVLEYTAVGGDVKGLSNVAVVTGDPDPETLDDPTDDIKEETPEVPVTVNPKVNPIPDPKPSLNLKDHMAYIIGYPDGTVRPQNNITRAEVATVFFRLLDESSREYYWSKTNEFNDVSSEAWYNNAISTLANAGIITGYPDGGFHPNAPITRAEYATIAARFSEVVYEGDNSFNDIPDKHWAAGFITLAEHLGWINGYPDGSFKPDQLITRAEAMTLTNRVLERATKAEDMHKDMIVWSDNSADAWFYEAVQEATNSHEYYRLNDKVENNSFNYEKWTKTLPAPDWSALEKSWSVAGDQ